MNKSEKNHNSLNAQRWAKISKSHTNQPIWTVGKISFLQGPCPLVDDPARVSLKHDSTPVLPIVMESLEERKRMLNDMELE